MPATGSSTGTARAPDTAELVAVMAPLIAALAEDGNGAVALAGSRGKGRSDAQSDYDFRVYAHGYRPDVRESAAWAAFEAARLAFGARGLRMDGVWMRRYPGVDADLAEWLAGTAVPKDYDWTIWGYHLPTDLATQEIVADPEGRLAGWKAQLVTYPEALRASVLAKYLPMLRYWAADYHYQSKVQRRDLVFLVGLSAKLTNAILQVLFALNRVYFPGDGWNLAMAAELDRLPKDFLARMDTILEPGRGPGTWARQRAELLDVIADMEALATG
jgi:hypothetical protein